MTIKVEENFDLMSINKALIENLKIDKNTKDFIIPKEGIDLYLPENCKDPLLVFYNLQDKNYIKSISVPFDFGCQIYDYINNENYQKNMDFYLGDKLKVDAKSNNTEAIHFLMNQQFYYLTKVQDVIYSKENFNILGYPNYNNQILRSLYFYDLPVSLEKITFRASDYFCSNALCFEDGMIYSNDKTILYRCLPSNSKEVLIIPDSVEIIAEKAFYNCLGIKKIFFPETIIYIGKSAFKNCPAYTV